MGDTINARIGSLFLHSIPCMMPLLPQTLDSVEHPATRLIYPRLSLAPTPLRRAWQYRHGFSQAVFWLEERVRGRRKARGCCWGIEGIGESTCPGVGCKGCQSPATRTIRKCPATYPRRSPASMYQHEADRRCDSDRPDQARRGTIAYASKKPLTHSEQIDTALSHYHTPDVLICTAGGTPTQVGFLADISPDAITSCIELNYYTTIFIVQYCLKLWLAAAPTSSPRHVLLTSSLAAFVGIPGFIAYTPTKVAIRALADTLREEFLLYGDNTFKIHVSFPGPFITEAFLEEQDNKPRLTKMLEGTDLSRTALEQKIASTRTVAQRIISGLEKGKTYVPVEWQGELLLNNMRGPSPRFWTLWDFFLGIIAACAWWFYRTSWDRKTRGFGASNGRENRV